MMRGQIFEQVKASVNAMVPYKECDYRNFIIAKLFTEGEQDKMTEDWLRKVLLEDVEDGFITYGQALTLAPLYKEVIEELKRDF